MLKVGLLWFDDTKQKRLTDKLDEAAERYFERFEARPTLALVHPSQAQGASHKSLRLEASTGIRPNHFLIGIDERSSDQVAPIVPEEGPAQLELLVPEDEDSRVRPGTQSVREVLQWGGRTRARRRGKRGGTGEAEQKPPKQRAGAKQKKTVAAAS